MHQKSGLHKVHNLLTDKNIRTKKETKRDKHFEQEKHIVLGGNPVFFIHENSTSYKPATFSFKIKRVKITLFWAIFSHFLPLYRRP
jgi:hypothetical protein